jgi:hypothetical protein
VNFNALKIFSVPCLNFDFVAFSLLVKKKCEQYSNLKVSLYAVFFSPENINPENVSLYAVFRSIFQR